MSRRKQYAAGVSGVLESIREEPALVPPPGPASRLERLALNQLRFWPDQQPRDMLPPAEWERLLAAGENTPAGALAALQRVADSGRPESGEVLNHVSDLARSVASEGVLQPVTIVELNGQLVVLDGHCRCMAAALTEQVDVPVRFEVTGGAGPEGELSVVAHRFLLNWTQKRLSPLEGMREVVRVAELAARVVYARHRAPGESDEGDAPVNELLGEAEAPLTPDLDAPEEPKEGRQRGRTRQSELAREVRDLVLAKTGLTVKRYQNLFGLRRLTPEAQARGASLSEGHLVQIVALPPELQALVVDLVAATQATVAQTRVHCRLARERGVDYIEEEYRKLRRQAIARRERTAVSWEPLLRAFPEDLTPRISALRAELSALDDEPRAKRIRALARQRALCEEAIRAFDDILALYGAGPTEPHEPAPPRNGAWPGA